MPILPKEKTFDSLVDALILEVLDREKYVERQTFKKIIYNLTDKLYKEGIDLSIDFRAYEDELDSNKLDDTLFYLISTGIVETIYSPIGYKLSEMVQNEGVNTYLDIIYKGIPLDIKRIFKDEVQKYCEN